MAAVLTEAQQGPRVGALLADRFRVLEVIGRGGMGIVVRAEDLLTGSEVAVKHVRPDLAQDPDYADRLLREAQLARDVSHHNICRVHDVYRHGNEVLLSMEYVHGETLRRRLDRGGLGEREALHIARQICAGVAAAHHKGVVHRDLKPENVLIDATGRAVVLDFGVARKEGSPRDTVTGIALGTPRYMAPEQQQGKAVCPATDVFALGLLIEELLGEHPPAWLRPIIRRATERSPRRRYQNASELLRELRRPWLHLPWLGKALGAAAAGGLLLAVIVRPFGGRGGLDQAGGHGAAGQKAILPPTSKTLLTRQWGGAHMGTVSPDGRLLAYLEENDGTITGLLRPLREETGQVRRFGLPGASISWISFSPNSRSLAFSTGIHIQDRNAEVYIVEASLAQDGKPRRLTDGTTPSWFPDGQSLVFSRYNQHTGRWHLARVPVAPVAAAAPGAAAATDPGAAGEAEPSAIDVEPAASRDLCPAVSPDGQRVAYMAGPAPGGVRLVPVGGGAAATLDPEPLFYDRIQWTADGRHIIYPADRGMTLIEATVGAQPRVILQAADLGHLPSLSADDRVLIFTRSPERYDMWTVDRLGRHPQIMPVTIPSDFLLWPLFSPDGQSIALTIGVGGNEGLQQVVLRPRFGGPERPLGPRTQQLYPESFTADGAALIVGSNRAGALKLVTLGGPAAAAQQAPPAGAQQMTFGEDEVHATISPDGTRLATTRAATAQGSVAVGLWVRPAFAPPQEARCWVADGDGWPSWSPDGALVAVPTKGGDIALSSGPLPGQTRRLPLTEPGGAPLRPRFIRFAPDGKLLAVNYRRIYEVDLLTGTTQPFMSPAGITNIFGLTISPDNKQIVYVAQPLSSDLWLVDPANQLLAQR